VSTDQDSAAVARVLSRLHEMWVPGPLSLSPATALDELRDWLADEHWWREGSHATWLALCADVDDALASAGSPLYAVASLPVDRLRSSLAAFTVALRQDKKDGRNARQARTAARRNELVGLEHAVRDALARPTAVAAAWQGLLEACRGVADENTLDQRQAELWHAAEDAGHPWDRLFRLMRGVLGDSERDIGEVRRDVAAGVIRLLPRPADYGPAGVPLSERLDLLEQYLRLPVADAHSEVWVAIDDAFIDGASFTVGAVTFWNGRELRAAAASNELLTLPPAVQRHTWLFQWLWERRDSESPFVLAQVDVGGGRPNAARDDARDTVRAMLVLAEFDEGYSSWKVADRGLLHFADGEWVFRNQLEPRARPAGLARARMGRDNTRQALETRAASLASHLPLRATTAQVRHTFELVHWLSRGRATPGSARIVLTKRVIERAAGWTGVPEATFTDDLAIPWARRRVVEHLGSAVRRALRVLEHDPAREAAWLEVHRARGIVRYTDAEVDAQIVLLDKAIENFAWLVDQLPDGSAEQTELKRLAPRVASGAALAAWVKEHGDVFVLLRNRYRRHRHAIVHGGPLSEESVDTILLFADALAVETLAAALDSVLARQPLDQYFARRKTVYERWLGALQTSSAPVHELFGVSM
jgi:hypothetical protein